MPLFANPPHACDVYTVSDSRDAGGGTQLTYTLAQAGVPCSINTADAATREQFAQRGIFVTHTVAFLSESLTATPGRGVKLVAADTGASFQVQGISGGRAYGGVPAFTYLHCEEQL